MTGSFEDAVAAVMRATELSPSDAFIWSMLARGFDLQFCRWSQLDAQTYRERAAQCLALAERAQRDDDKATWL
jgi:hypothetical protein